MGKLNIITLMNIAREHMDSQRGTTGPYWTRDDDGDVIYFIHDDHVLRAKTEFRFSEKDLEYLDWRDWVSRVKKALGAFSY